MNGRFFCALFFLCACVSSIQAAGRGEGGGTATPAASATSEVSQARAVEVFREICAICHSENRFGGIGPALLPENLERLKKAEALDVIKNGRPATQMIGYSSLLKPGEAEALVSYIYSKAVPAPRWEAEDIKASHILNEETFKLPAVPNKLLSGVDPLNLFIVVETGDQHVSLLDGDKFKRLHRFPSRYALHGGPKFSPDGRFVYFASRDGWITKYDIYNQVTVAEIRAGLNARNAAVSSDGKWVMVANYLPHSLVVLDARDLSLARIIPAIAGDGSGKSSRVSAVYDAAPRKSFIAALKDIPEAWEISYDPNAGEVSEGMIHDFQYKEGVFKPGFLYPRRTFLQDYLDDFFFTQSYDEIVGASRTASKGQVIFLDGRKKVADLDLTGMPHLGSGITWAWKDVDGIFGEKGAQRTVLATPNLNDPEVSIIDMETWKTIKKIPTLGPGFFMRSHENSRYAWVDSMMSPKYKDTLQVIDKESLEVVARLTPVPGKTLAHIEFTRDGKYALASLWEMDGALIVFDAKTLKEVKRIPASKPVGKYNIWNKITRSEGTSH
ncbi:MAG: nitrite reductase [Betaproteobacteria bacterium]|nr:nitrite reductase [Betaproteobacteria bacterium]